MPKAMSPAVKLRNHHSFEVMIHVDFSAAGVRLTPAGEVAVLGFVHYYLGTWAARVADGAVRPPSSWPELTYECAPMHLAMPAIPEEASEVMHKLRSVFCQPDVLVRIQVMPRDAAEGPAR